MARVHVRVGAGDSCGSGSGSGARCASARSGQTFRQKGQPSNSNSVMGFSGRGKVESLSDVSTSFRPERHVTACRCSAVLRRHCLQDGMLCDCALWAQGNDCRNMQQQSNIDGLLGT